MGPAAVTVGVDGGAMSGQAVEWGAEEASLRRAPLRLVNVADFTAHVAAFAPAPTAFYGLVQEQGRRALDEAARRAAQVAPEISVESVAMAGSRVPVLEEESRRSSVLVIGAHEGLMTMHGLGSLVTHLAAHSHCPLVVVRQPETVAPGDVGTARVVVGVDGSDRSLEAVTFAAEHAAASKAELQVVMAVNAPRELWVYPEFADELLGEGRRWVSESLAGQRERHPGLTVSEHVLASHPVPALVDAARGARLLVVGSHGRGRFAGMLLGSVSQAVLRRAGCPVAVVRHGVA